MNAPVGFGEQDGDAARDGMLDRQPSKSLEAVANEETPTRLRRSATLHRALKRLSLAVTPLVEEIFAWAAPHSYRRLMLNEATLKLGQLQMLRHYEQIAAGQAPRIDFERAEFRAYSQNGEDGILLYIFGLIGTVNKIAVEICCGDGIECNSANLIVNQGWSGLLFDGDPINIRKGTLFYRRCRDTMYWPPELRCAWITAETVNDLIMRNGVRGVVDLLSIDMDGVDYWIWDAINVIDPRVVVVEFNAILGPDRTITVPYRPDFSLKRSTNNDYCGASLAAFVKLARKKGYRLVGVQSSAVNAFFVKRGIGENLLPEVSMARYFQHPKVRSLMENRLSALEKCDWVSV